MDGDQRLQLSSGGSFVPAGEDLEVARNIWRNENLVATLWTFVLHRNISRKAVQDWRHAKCDGLLDRYTHYQIHPSWTVGFSNHRSFSNQAESYCRVDSREVFSGLTLSRIG